MNNKVKAIRGGQITPIPTTLAPECIRVQKVWDWTVSQNQQQFDIAPPAECSAAIAAFMAANPGVPLIANCTTPTPDLSVPIVPSPAPVFCPPDELCCVEIGREPVTLPGNIPAQLVAIVNSVPLTITVTDPAGNVICGPFTTIVKLFQKDVLCAPEGTNVLCRITQVVCDSIVLSSTQIIANVAICKELQVEAEVKLEVLAKFCKPRQPITPPENPIICPPVGQFPPQCPDLFPPVNCQCQLLGSLEAFGAAATLPTGAVTANAVFNFNICPNCTPEFSSFTATFTPVIPAGPAVNFVANDFTVPTCSPVAIGTTATGTGTVNGTAVNWTLTVTGLNPATVTFTALNAATGAVVVAGVFVGDENSFLEVESCL